MIIVNLILPNELGIKSNDDPKKEKNPTMIFPSPIPTIGGLLGGI